MKKLSLKSTLESQAVVVPLFLPINDNENTKGWGVEVIIVESVFGNGKYLFRPVELHTSWAWETTNKIDDIFTMLCEVAIDWADQTHF